MRAISVATWQRLFREGVPFSQFLPYIAYDPDGSYFINADHSLSFIAEFSPLPQVELLKVDATERLLGGIKAFLANPDIPAGSALQFIVYASPFFEDKLEKWFEFHSRSKIPFVRTIAEHRKRFYLEHRHGFFPNEPFVPRVFRHFFTFRLFPKKRKKKQTISRAEFDRMAETGIKVWGSMMDSLRSILAGSSSPDVKQLDAQQFIHFMREVINQRVINTPYNPEYPVRDQILIDTAGIEVFKDGRFTLVGRYVPVISVIIPPNKPFIHDVANLLGDLLFPQANIPYPFMLTVNYEILDQFSTRNRIQGKQAVAALQSHSPLAMFSPKLRLKADALSRALEGYERGDGFIKVSMHMAIFAPTYEQARKAAQTAQDTFQRAGFTVTEERPIALSVFLWMLPMAFDPKVDKFANRLITVHHSNAANLTVPAIGEWSGSSEVKHSNLLFITRRGQLVTTSLFDSSFSYNAIVVATSGAGKSFLINEIIMSYLSEGAKVYVVDVGYSYQRSTELITSSQFFEFELDNPQYILNPFSYARSKPDSDREITDTDASFLRSIVYEMARPSSGGPLPPIAEAVIEKAVRDVFREKGSDATVADVAEAIRQRGEEEKDRRILDISRQLFTFTEGSFSSFFNGQSNINFDSDYIVLEMTGLKGEANIPLMRVVLMILFYRLLKDVEQGDRGRKKLLVIDEAWKLLSTKQAADVIETAYRTFRKFNASAITVTQSFMDFFTLTEKGYQYSAAGRAIVPNAPFWFLLKQRDYRVFEQEFDPDLLEILKTVTTHKGKYSEIFLVGPRGNAILRFVVDKASYWIYTTDASDRAIFDKVMKRYLELGLPKEEAIVKAVEELANERRQ